MAKTKPLPCPFCGGAKLQLLHRDCGWWFVCKKCDALGHRLGVVLWWFVYAEAKPEDPPEKRSKR